MKLEWFQNKQFRQAVAHTIDKSAIIDDVQHGLGYPQWSSISPATGDFHNPNVRRYEYDLDTANAILDSLGWTDSDGDGIREDSEGNPIEFSLVTNTGNSVRENVGTIITQGMKDIGLDSATPPPPSTASGTPASSTEQTSRTPHKIMLISETHKSSEHLDYPRNTLVDQTTNPLSLEGEGWGEGD